jgi:hypothetical protein
MALRAERTTSSAGLRRDLDGWLRQLDAAAGAGDEDENLSARVGRICHAQEWAMRAPTPR